MDRLNGPGAEPLRGARPAARAGTAILAFTREGTALAARLAHALTDTRPLELQVPERFAAGLGRAPGIAINPGQGPLSARVARLFATHAELLFIGATGIAVRLIAPLLQDKLSDPAVLVIDETGRFVIPILGGHLGGANVSARRLAERLGATAVLTTASDVQGTIAVDLLGRELGWHIEAERTALLQAAAAVVNGERVVIIEEDCGREWWPHAGPLPEHLHPVPSWEQAGEAGAYLWVTRRSIDPAVRAALGPRLILYRPPCASRVAGAAPGRDSSQAETAPAHHEIA
ncbi:MAG: cobalamin biosynthesis protein CbiG [Sphingobacteriia bacterium]|nr:cobalamin biosynthesis protein CbiG [Sphingobacteriia bacterium]NCC37835.1 cobalamin biosynthesis protein CbiG [Gammaproteobacteria bacterium]